MQRLPARNAALTLSEWQFHTIDGKHLARIDIEPSNHPINDRKHDPEIFWYRTPVATISVTDPIQRDHIITKRWPPKP